MVDGTQTIIHAITLALYRNSHVRKVVSVGATTGGPLPREGPVQSIPYEINHVACPDLSGNQRLALYHQVHRTELAPHTWW